MKMTEKQAWEHIADVFAISNNGRVRGLYKGVCDEITELCDFDKISEDTYEDMNQKIMEWELYGTEEECGLYKAPMNAEGARWRAKKCMEEAKNLQNRK